MYHFMYILRSILAAATVLVLSLTACGNATAQDESGSSPSPALNDNPMTAERLGQLIRGIDEEAKSSGPVWAFSVADLEVAVIYDVSADRMRIIIPIGPIEDVPKEELVRILQANFDSALDARYAIADGKLWGAFIHPLSELSDEEFLVGLGETANVVLTYGTTYSSGLFIYGGGDSAEMQRNLIEELRNQRT